MDRTAKHWDEQWDVLHWVLVAAWISSIEISMGKNKQMSSQSSQL